MLRVTVLERGRLIRDEQAPERGEADRGTPSRRAIPARLYDRLFRSEAAREERGERIFSWRRAHCLVGPWVGVLQIPGMQLEILPKTDDGEAPEDEAYIQDTRRNLMEMLLRAGLGAVRARGLADVSLRHGSLHDQLVAAFFARATHELRRGVDRQYLPLESNLRTLRGKLVLSRHIAKNSVQKHRFYCRHDQLSAATPISIRIKQACRVLSLRPLPTVLRSQCQILLSLLDEVPEHGRGQHAPVVVFNRQNERFADIYAFASMVMDGQAPDARAGTEQTFSLLFDMEQVFERYVAAFLRGHVLARIPGLRLFPQAVGQRYALFRDVDARGRGDILRLAPDLLFTLEQHGETNTLIIDTKWKRLSHRTSRYARPNNSDLYQLYAYLHRYSCDSAVLLYPWTQGVSSRDFDALAGRAGDRVGAIGIRFANLKRRLWTTQGRAALADELEEIVREGFGLPARQQVHSSAVTGGAA